MKDLTSHIKKAAQHIALSEAERADMSRVTREYMAMKPLSHHARSTFISIHWSAFAYRPIALALVFLVIGSGSVSYAAESALPGDALYAVKTKINEQIKVALATDTEARANVQMELAERRIQEAAALAVESRLDVETQNELTVAFETHATKATENVVIINEEDASAAAEITSRFETRLAAHEAVFAQVRGARANKDSDTLSNAIRGVGLAVADIRARAEERIAVSAPVATTMALSMDAAPAMETMALRAAPAELSASQAVTSAEDEMEYDARAASRMRSAAESQLKAAQKKFKSTRSKLDASAKAEVEAELEHAEELIDDGRTFLKDATIAHAYHSFQESLVISERISVLLNASTALKKSNWWNSSASARSEAANSRAALEDRIRERTGADARFEATATMSATASPIDIELDAAASATHQVLPVIPPSMQIFRFHDDDEREEEEDEWEDENEREHDTSSDKDLIKLDLSL